MANTKNPYTPGAGRPPAYLAGREKELNDIQGILDDLSDNDCVRSVIFYGLRGVGKTVLLNEIDNTVPGFAKYLRRFHPEYFVVG